MKTLNNYDLLRRCNKSFKLFLKISISITFLLFFHYASAQSISRDVTVSAGDYYAGDQFSISWSIGECIVETASDSHITLTQGFHQPNLIITEISSPEQGEYTISVYPNPTADHVYIQTQSLEMLPLRAELFDMRGNKLLSQTLTGDVTQFNVKQLPVGMYLLKVSTKNGDKQKLFKVQKIR